MPQSHTNLLCHVVFSTKDRRPVITDEIESRLHEYLGGMVKSRRGIALAIGGMPDHVHLLIKIRPDHSLADLLRDLKSISSGWIHDTFPAAKAFDWQDGYAAFSVSASQAARVIAYIRNQRKHHKKTNSRDELIKLLKAHGVDFDERYV